MRRFRKPVCRKRYREFESPPLRIKSHNPRFVRGLFHFRVALSCTTVLFREKNVTYFGSAMRKCSLASSKAVVEGSRARTPRHG